MSGRGTVPRTTWRRNSQRLHLVFDAPNVGGLSGRDVLSAAGARFAGAILTRTDELLTRYYGTYYHVEPTPRTARTATRCNPRPLGCWCGASRTTGRPSRTETPRGSTAPRGCN